MYIVPKAFDMALKIIDHGTIEYDKMVALRYDVLRKPLGLTFSNQDLEKEKEDILMGCFDDDKLEGCCLLTKENDGSLRLRQMAVLDGLQGKGIGRVLMNYAENIARDSGVKKVKMHARKTALGFYEKLGYKACGNEFDEVSIPHFVMEKEL